MKLQLHRFALWFSLYYLFTQFNRDLQYYLMGNELKWWWESNQYIQISGFMSFLLQAGIVFVLLRFVYPRFGIWLSLPIIITSFPLLISLRYLIQEVITKSITGIGNYNPGTDWIYYFIDNIYFSSVYVAFSLVYFLIIYGQNQEREKHEIIIQQSKAELDFLRAQINPHFLFNGLNSIYSLVYQKSEKALRAIEILSQISRQMIYEKREFANSAEEIIQLKNFIDLQKIRFGESCFVEEIIDPKEHSNIPTHLLIPLTENAFKHGIYNDKNKAIKIEINSDSKWFNLMIRNAKNQQLKDKRAGVGLSNVKRRLELLYPNTHSFIVHETDSEFEIRIKLPIHESK